MDDTASTAAFQSEVNELRAERDAAYRKASDALSTAERLTTENGDLRKQLRDRAAIIGGVFIPCMCSVESRAAAFVTDDHHFEGCPVYERLEELELPFSERNPAALRQRLAEAERELAAEREAHAKTRALLEASELRSKLNFQALENECAAHAKTRAELHRAIDAIEVQRLYAQNIIDSELRAHAETREELAAALEDNADAESHLAALHAEFDRHCAATECTPAERKVLEEMAALRTEFLRYDWCTWRTAADAEIARRGEKP